MMSVKFLYGEEGVASLLEMIKMEPVLHGAKNKELRRLSLAQKAAFKRVHDAFVAVFPPYNGENASQQMLWVCWRNLRKKFFAGKAPRCWLSRLAFLGAPRVRESNPQNNDQSSGAPEVAANMPFYEQPMLGVAGPSSWQPYAVEPIVHAGGEDSRQRLEPVFSQFFQEHLIFIIYNSGFHSLITLILAGGKTDELFLALARLRGSREPLEAAEREMMNVVNLVAYNTTTF
uniref:OHCU_decarbox domain-containing protein n=1 Tax=Steinernema glaseri TaxID=37863 RepID=A0A1I8A9W2_9BILA